MTLSRDELTTGIIDELEVFGRLVSSLSPEDLEVPTRCAGWTVRDVAAHVIGSMVDVVEGRLDGLGSPEVTEREVAERRGRTAAELAEELAGATKSAADLLALFDDAAWEGPAGGGYDGTLRQGVEALYYDTYLHGDDILAALGRPSVGGPGVRAALHHIGFELEKRGWDQAPLDVDGVDALPFILAATGRAPAMGDTPNIYAD